MEHSFNIEGFSKHPLTTKGNGLLTPVVIWQEGKPAPRGKKRGQVLVINDKGEEVIARPSFGFLTMAPGMVINGETYSAPTGLKWYETVWSAFPVVLAVLGGLVGAVLGLAAAYSNVAIFRSKLHPALKYIATGVITVAAFVFLTLLGAALYQID